MSRFHDQYGNSIRFEWPGRSVYTCALVAMSEVSLYCRREAAQQGLHPHFQPISNRVHIRKLKMLPPIIYTEPSSSSSTSTSKCDELRAQSDKKKLFYSSIKKLFGGSLSSRKGDCPTPQLARLPEARVYRLARRSFSARRVRDLCCLMVEFRRRRRSRRRG